MMTTSIQELDGKLVATLSGELDTAAARETEQALQPSRVEPQGRCIFHMGSLLTATGIAFLQNKSGRTQSTTGCALNLSL